MKTKMSKNSNWAIEAFIEASVSENCIPVIAGSSDVHSYLLVECDDSVEADGGVTEYWGTTDAGETWRVHVRD